MCDRFLCDCESNIINYGDDTTIYACEPIMYLVLSKLEKGISTVLTWFQNNYLKAEDRCDKSNYRPVSILPLLLKLFERILYEQIYSHTKDIFSEYWVVFEKIQFPTFITSNV